MGIFLYSISKKRAWKCLKNKMNAIHILSNIYNPYYKKYGHTTTLENTRWHMVMELVLLATIYHTKTYEFVIILPISRFPINTTSLFENHYWNPLIMIEFIGHNQNVFPHHEYLMLYVMHRNNKPLEYHRHMMVKFT